MLAKERQRARLLQQAFNLTSSEWDKILVHQKGVCYICKRPPRSTRFHTDHDHKTGLIRGLLCSQCNRALGKAEDPRWQWTPWCFFYAFLYLLIPPAVVALDRKVFGFPGKIGTLRYRKWVKKKVVSIDAPNGNR